MGWRIWVAGLILLFSTYTTAYFMTPIDGGGVGLRVARNPFYEGALGILSVEITNPVDNTTYYTNTHDLNATLGGAYTCQYRINTNAWNSYVCVGSECTQQVTFSEGENNVTVSCNNGYGESGSDSVVFTVILFGRGPLLPDLGWMLAIPLLLVFFLLIIDCED